MIFPFLGCNHVKKRTNVEEVSLIESVVDVAEGIALGVGGVLDFQIHGEDYA